MKKKRSVVVKQRNSNFALARQKKRMESMAAFNTAMEFLGHMAAGLLPQDKEVAMEAIRVAVVAAVAILPKLEGKFVGVSTGTGQEVHIFSILKSKLDLRVAQKTVQDPAPRIVLV